MLSMFSKCLTHKVQIHQKFNFISNIVGPSDAASGSGAAHTPQSTLHCATKCMK